LSGYDLKNLTPSENAYISIKLVKPAPIITCNIWSFSFLKSAFIKKYMWPIWKDIANVISIKKRKVFKQVFLFDGLK